MGRLVAKIAASGRRLLASAGVEFVVAALAASVAASAALAQVPEIASRKAAGRTSFSDDEIKDGFFKIAFRAELQFGQPAGVIRKFDGPVRIFVVNRGAPERRAELAKIVADIRAHVDHLDVAVTDDRQAANFFVTLLRRRDLARTIRSYYGTHKARDIERALKPECLSGIGKDSSFRILRAEALLPVDTGDFAFYDCAYEELLQGLGVINDDNSVPWTMFNDDVQMGFFDVYDQYLVNILYDPRLRAGMTPDQVRALLPEILPTVRAWVASAHPPRDAPEKNNAPGDQ